MIYLDNAATTLRKPPQVIDAVARAMGSFGNSARGTHEGALTASRTIYNTRCKLAALFGCPRPDHVVFTANSTEALNITINGLVRPGDHVLSTDLEHNSVLRPLYRLRDERGVVCQMLSRKIRRFPSEKTMKNAGRPEKAVFKPCAVCYDGRETTDGRSAHDLS